MLPAKTHADCSVFIFRLNRLRILGHPQSACVDSDKTLRMRRLIVLCWVAGRTCSLVGNAVPQFKYEPAHDTPTKWHVRPAKTQINLGIRPVWSESSLAVRRKFGSLATHWTHSEDSDQTGRMSRLIWVFALRSCHFVGFVMRWFIYFTALTSMRIAQGLIVCSTISEGNVRRAIKILTSLCGYLLLCKAKLHLSWFISS